MIKVTFDFIDFALDMNGHADAPREGEFDLVCCAASTIGQQLIYSLENYNERHHGIAKLEVEMDKGHLHVRARTKEWARLSVKQRMEYAREGMEMLAERYPEYIETEEV